jgi:hypothetical protein
VRAAQAALPPSTTAAMSAGQPNAAQLSCAAVA